MVHEYTKDSIINDGNVFLFFYAAYNSNCNLNKELLEKLSKDFPEVTFFKINTTAYHNVKRAYDVTKIPAYLFLRNGQEFGRITGNTSSYVLRNYIKKYI